MKYYYIIGLILALTAAKVHASDSVTVSPLGDSMVITQPGKPTVICNPLGDSMICN